MTSIAARAAGRAGATSAAVRLVDRAVALLSRIPDGLIATGGRFSIAAVFWKSGQTKIEGLAIDLVDGTISIGWPRLSESALALFETEYRLPLISAALAAPMAAVAEHVFPLLTLPPRNVLHS
ncbi:DoxX family membrane protein [Roseateles sp.]|uniref:DoxX family membrane protein n=1 Tax=Roseateles sp. TaxID=1971397 RepID=UPI00286A1C25|nr:DoxX family membrane protein [Roseateles sp.]